MGLWLVTNGDNVEQGLLAWDVTVVLIQPGGHGILPSDFRAVAFDSQMRDLDRMRLQIPRFANDIHQDGPAGPIGRRMLPIGT